MTLFKKVLCLPSLLTIGGAAGVVLGLVNKENPVKEVKLQVSTDEKENVPVYLNCIGTDAKTIKDPKVQACRKQMGFTWDWFSDKHEV